MCESIGDQRYESKAFNNGGLSGVIPANYDSQVTEGNSVVLETTKVLQS